MPNQDGSLYLVSFDSDFCHGLDHYTLSVGLVQCYIPESNSTIGISPVDPDHDNLIPDFFGVISTIDH